MSLHDELARALRSPYYHGEPCGVCGSVQRYVRTHQCVPCRRAKCRDRNRAQRKEDTFWPPALREECRQVREVERALLPQRGRGWIG